ncbi:MAG: type II secretion system protein N [Pseudomonadota bacterium]
MAVAARDRLDQSAASAGSALRKATQWLQRHKGANAAGGWAPAVAEIILAGLLGLTVLVIAMALFSPLPAPQSLPVALSAPAASQQTVSELSENPFRTAAASLEVVAPTQETTEEFAETSLDLALHGAMMMGDKNSAIIETPDGEQVTVYAGEEIWNGVILDRVYADRVIIISNGVRETLRIIDREQRASSISSASSGAAPARRTNAQPPKATNNNRGNLGQSVAIGDVAVVSPKINGDKITLIVRPGRERRAFAQSGLRNGDEIVAVNGRRIGPNALKEARDFALAAKSGELNLTVNRDGETLRVDVALPVRGREKDDG